MILISHRGNVLGRNEEKENSPEYINNSLLMGYDVEIDVWYINGDYFLGHDSPDYKIDESFLENDKLWCHCKNIESLYSLINNDKVHSFWHQEDDVTLTSKKYLWTYPGKKITNKSIAVMPEIMDDWDFSDCVGVCSDYIKKYKTQ